MHETQRQGVKGVTLDDIYLGNGASELISLATNALLDNGDELLLPALTIPCGQRRPASRVAHPCTTSVTKTMAGCPAWTTFAAK